MSEALTLTTPEVKSTTTTDYIVVSLTFNWEAKYILIQVRGTNGERREFRYDEVDGSVALMRALNKVDLSVKSLHRRVLERLISDGRLAGSVTGSPD